MKILLFLVFYCSFICNFAKAIPSESTLNVNGGVFSYFGSHDLEGTNTEIQDALIIIHGSDRNADTYYTTGELIAGKLNRSNNILIIAPHFKLASDTLLPYELTFTDEGWLRGDESIQLPVSSFDVMDKFVSLLLDRTHFPNLKTITITGHSAGGQLTQRYAIGNSFRFGRVQIRYVVANPGSYAYLTPKRPVKGSPGMFEIPDSSTCSNFNDFKYGLNHLNSYMAHTHYRKMVRRYLNRDVTYLLGEKDLDTTELDNDCPAQMQGSTRFERGLNFKADIDYLFPKNHHTLVTVPEVAHSERALYTSELGMKALTIGF